MVPASTSLARLLRETADDLASRVTGASVSAVLWRGGRAVVRVHTDAQAGGLSDFQVELLEGPPVAALTSYRPVLVDDYRVDRRWPQVRRRAGDMGLRAQRSTVSPTAAGPLTLCLLSRRAGSFREGSVAAGFHDQAAVHAVTTLRLWAERVRGHRSAVVDRALGVVMATQGCAADEALVLMREQAAADRRPLTALAADLLDRDIPGHLRRDRPDRRIARRVLASR